MVGYSSARGKQFEELTKKTEIKINTGYCVEGIHKIKPKSEILLPKQFEQPKKGPEKPATPEEQALKEEKDDFERGYADYLKKIVSIPQRLEKQ